MTFAARSSWNSGAAAPPPAGPQWVVTYDLALYNVVNVEFVGATDTTIDWGDGTVEAFTSAGVASHTYAALSGLVPVTIYGTCGELVLNYRFTAITSWEAGLTPIVTLYSDELADVPNFLPVDLTKITFTGCSIFNSVGVVTWDVSNIPDMASMFEDCAAFNQDISGWNTSAVTNMNRMFSGASAFNQDISGWNTGAVADMAFMFANASAFDQPIGVWDTSAVLTMQGTFNSALAFNQDISGWVTTSVTNMADIFSNAQVFNQPVGAWDTSAVTDMSFAFNNTLAFNQPLDAWNVSLVTSMSYMFADSLFNQDISGWCVALIPSPPFNFATGGALTLPFYPVWGTCPVVIPFPLTFYSGGYNAFGAISAAAYPLTLSR